MCCRVPLSGCKLFPFIFGGIRGREWKSSGNLSAVTRLTLISKTPEVQELRCALMSIGGLFLRSFIVFKWLQEGGSFFPMPGAQQGGIILLAALGSWTTMMETLIGDLFSLAPPPRVFGKPGMIVLILLQPGGGGGPSRVDPCCYTRRGSGRAHVLPWSYHKFKWLFIYIL